MSRARHHMKHGGHKAKGGKVDYYEGGESNVAHEAAEHEQKKHGGRIHGKKAHKRLDKRARGGKVEGGKSGPFAPGSATRPFSMAAK